MRDLSGQLLSDRGLIAGSSMSPTNTISVIPDLGQPGSQSEASLDVTPRQPGFELPAQAGPTTVVDGTGSPDQPYRQADGHGWFRAEPETGIDYGQARGPDGRWVQT